MKMSSPKNDNEPEKCPDGSVGHSKSFITEKKYGKVEIHGPFCDVKECPTDLIDPEFEQDFNNFTFKMVNTINSKYCSNKNMVCSPFSLSTCIAMTLLGARNETQNEIQKMLGFRSSEIHKTFGRLIDCYILLMNYSNQIRFNFINKMFIKKKSEGAEIPNALKETMSRSYGAIIEETDFESNDKELRDKLNDWISMQTSEKIKTLFKDTLPTTTKLLLLNVVFFKGKWLNKFDSSLIKNMPFYNYGDKNQAVDIPMMQHLKTRFKYGDLSIGKCAVQIVEIPFAGDLTMILIVPKELNGVNELTQSLNMCQYSDVKDKLTTEQVEVIIPKFKVECSYNMKDALMDLGIKKAFIEEEADFSGIRSTKDLCITEVYHKAVIEVDEEGFGREGDEAIKNDITVIATVLANRPFMFLIRDTYSGIILLQGKIEHF